MHIEIFKIDIINGEQILHELPESKIVCTPEEINEFQEEIRKQYLDEHPDCVALACYRTDITTSERIRKYFHDKEEVCA